MKINEPDYADTTQLSEPELKQFYENRARAKFPTSDNPENEAVIGKVIDELNLSAGDTILDFGCADGYFIKAVKLKCPSVNAFGIDLIEHSAWFQSAATITFKAGDLPLPFPDRFFDAVYSSQVFEHLEDPKLAAREIDRVLKPGGRIWIATPNSYAHTWKAFHGLQRRIDKIEGHFRHFSAHEIYCLFPQNLYRVERTRYDLFIGLYIYYRFIAYNFQLKAKLLNLVAPELMSTNCRTSEPAIFDRNKQSLPKKLAFLILRVLRRFDELFKHSNLCQVVEVTLSKNSPR